MIKLNLVDTLFCSCEKSGYYEKWTVRAKELSCEEEKLRKQIFSWVLGQKRLVLLVRCLRTAIWKETESELEKCWMFKLHSVDFWLRCLDLLRSFALQRTYDLRSAYKRGTLRIGFPRLHSVPFAADWLPFLVRQLVKNCSEVVSCSRCPEKETVVLGGDSVLWKQTCSFVSVLQAPWGAPLRATYFGALLCEFHNGTAWIRSVERGLWRPIFL